MNEIIDTRNMRTWHDVEPTIRNTYIGFNLHDLRNKWLVAYEFPNGELGYMLAGLLYDRVVWGDLFMHDMLVLSKREADRLAKYFIASYPNIKVVSIRERLGR